MFWWLIFQVVLARIDTIRGIARFGFTAFRSTGNTKCEHWCRKDIPRIPPEITRLLLFLKSRLEYVDACGVPQHSAYLVLMESIP